ncbi:MAG: hypothetical protein GTO03_10140, partial [Planctomycetales bacterium]|nr:hypothetical protein [Planctomycetales bacterium]
GDSYTVSESFTLPPGIDGTYYLYLQTSVGGTTNRVGFPRNDLSRPYFETHIYETPNQDRLSEPIPVTYREPDLTVTELELPATPPGSGETFAVTYTPTRAAARPAAQSGTTVFTSPSIRPWTKPTS